MILDAIGIILGFVIGGACRWFDLPSPAPPTITGALLVFLMSVGFVLGGFLPHL